MNESAGAFGWHQWPFRIVADEEFARVWADRTDLRQELDRRVRRLSSISHSTVQMIWADFGAGKSHTLRRLEVICSDNGATGMIPFYTEIPVGAAGFIDLYRRLVGAMKPELLSELSRIVTRGAGHPAGTPGARDLRQALRLLGSDDASGRDIASDWMQASPGLPHLKSLKAYGIGSRIEDDLRAVEVITELIRLVRTRAGSSVLWLVDEFQRVADLPTKKRDAFAKNVVTLFNSCPAGLHFVLSFSVAQQSTALDLMPADLRSRALTFPMLKLPNMSGSDCGVFARDLFAAFRSEPHTDKCFPFAEESLELVITDLEERTAGAVTPRILMDRLEAVLFEALDSASTSPRLPLDVTTVAGLLDAIGRRA